MIQAVIHFEMLLAGRRRRVFFLRWIYAAFLLVQVAPIFFMSPRQWTQLLLGFSTYGFFETFLVQHYVLLTLLTPALVGGTITEEKTRGTLQYLLTADIRPGELILGKMLAHLYQLAVLSLVGLPLLSFFAGLATDLTFPLVVFATSMLVLFGVAALSMLVSVLCRTTRDALLTLYLMLGGTYLLAPFLALTPLGPALSRFNPLEVLSLDDHELRWQNMGPFVLSWLVFAVACVALACWQLRRAYRRQLQVRDRKHRWFGRAETRRVRGNPILWREQKVEGIAPLEFLRAWPRWIGMAAVMVASLATLGYMLVRALPGGVNAGALVLSGEWPALFAAMSGIAGDVYFWHGLAVLLIMTLMVAIRASGAITGEKENATWLAVVMTPLTTQKIVTGKHWGIIWACLPYVAAHAAVVVPVSFLLGVEAFTWACLWALGTLAAICLGSAVGLWCSARASSSWRSLIVTLSIFYLGWLLFVVPVTVVLLVFKGIIDLVLRIIGLFADTSGALTALDSADIVGWSLCFGLAIAFYVLTQRLLSSAVDRVGRNDRTMEFDFDFYFMYRDYYLKKEKEGWDAPNLEAAYGEDQKPLDKNGPIPFEDPFRPAAQNRDGLEPARGSDAETPGHTVLRTVMKKTTSSVVRVD